MKNKSSDQWFPFYIDKWFFGSTRLELEPDERSVWVDLLTLSKKDDGFIRGNVGVPYLPQQLCGFFVIKEELLTRTIEKCIKFGKITRLEDGTLFVNSHQKYKLSRQGKYKAMKRIASTDDFPPERNPGLQDCKPGLRSRSPKGEENRGEENRGKEKKKLAVELNADDIRLVQVLIDLMLKNNPESVIIKRLTENRQRVWINQCRLLRESDGKTLEQIEAVIRFSQRDSFWKGNILSMPTLREKWDQLWMKMRRDTGADRSDGIKEWYDAEKRKEEAGGPRETSKS